MDLSNPTILIAGLILAVMALATMATYAWLVAGIAKNGGKVSVEKIGLPDIVAGGALVAYFMLLVFVSLRSPDRQIHDSDLVANAVCESIVLVAIFSFIHFRGINLAAQFGLRALKLYKVPVIAFLLLLAFYPVMICASLATQKILGPEAKPQELIKLFSDASAHMNYRTLLYMLVTATVIAPVFEEVVFRGYIYVILKRYLGITAGVLLNAALFAAIHVSAFAFPALFLFAICLTLAYEFTGSILVNICMHSLFNFCALAAVFYYSSHSQ